MELAYGIEKAANEASALNSLLFAVTEAAFNRNHATGQFEDAFNYLCNMASRQAENLKVLEDEAFKLLQKNNERRTGKCLK